MNIRSAGKAAVAALTLSLALAASAPVRAEVPAVAKVEIDHLLTYVGNSGCEFYRNGSWYDSKKGQAHMSDKYNFLRGTDMIHDTTDFIANAATQSSMTRLAYKVRCNGAEPVESAKWLGEELLRYRAASKNPVRLQLSKG